MPSLVSKKRRLQGHVQQGGFFQKVDLRSGQCFQSVWESVTFEDSLLSMLHLVASKWVHCHLVRTTLYGGNWNAATVHDTIFDDCDMEQASFAGAILRNVHFRNCRLTYGTFAGATLNDVVFESCNLHGADLDVAYASGVQYSKCNLWGVKTAFNCQFWTSGFDVETCNRFAAMLARVHPDPAAKMALMQMAGELTYNAIDRLMRAEPDTTEF